MSLLAVDALLIGLFAVVAGLLAWALLRATGAPETQQVRRTVQCPALDRPAEVVLLRDVRTGRLTSVAQCSLRSPGQQCHAECARLLELGAALEPRDAGPPAPRGAAR